MRLSPTVFLVATLFAAAPCLNAIAQSTGITVEGARNVDRDAPVEVTSDQLEMDQAAGTALFTGDVVVIQGDLRLAAPRILVEYTTLPDGSLGDTVDQITANGGRVLMVTPEEAAESDVAVYRPEEDKVTMTGDVLLTQGPNTLNGTRLVFDLETGVGRMDGGRVRTILTPGSGEP